MSGAHRKDIHSLGASFRERYGPWAVVTGASDGIGREFACVLAENKLNLVLCARRGQVLQDLANELSNAYQIQCRIVVADLSQAGAHPILAQATEDIDVGLLVAAAGFGSSGLFVDGDPIQEEQMIMLNCVSVMHQCHTFSRRLATRGKGGIILLSSVLAFMGTPRSANYAATKAYVQSLAEALREELRSAGVDVLASAPGPTASGFAARAHLQMQMAMTPRTIATGTLNALGKVGTVRPGWLSKLLGWSLATAPRWLRIKIIGLVMKGMAVQP